MNAETNPYSAPASAIQETAPAEAAPALWNPNAAASWSLLFSPIFGAYLQMRNWQALGDAQKAQQSWYWCIAALVLLFVFVGLAIALPEGHPLEKISSRSGLFVLLAWYLSHGKLQVAYVKEHFGKDYPRKSWGAPLGIAFAALIAFFVVVVVASVMLAALGLIQVPA